MPKFSIIIPVYNVAPYLRECLESVCNAAKVLWKDVGCEGEDGQRLGLPLVEAICVDDGSTDGSSAIIDDFKELVERNGSGRCVRIVAVRQQNMGVSAARNAALDIATGEWLVFLDADDVLRSNALQCVFEVSKQGSVDVVQYEWFRFGNGEPCSQRGLPYSTFDITNEISGYRMDGDYLTASHNVFKRLKCCDIRFKPYICGEDRLYTFECLLKMSRLVHIPDCLYGYRVRPMSYTTSVIKTFRGWEGELAYRLEFLDIADRSPKRVGYSNAQWLVHYLAFEHCKGLMFSSSLTCDEKKILFELWRAALPALMKSPAFSWLQHLELRIQKFFCTYERVFAYFKMKQRWFGPQCLFRRWYRRIRRHGEFSNQK